MFYRPQLLLWEDERPINQRIKEHIGYGQRRGQQRGRSADNNRTVGDSDCETFSPKNTRCPGESIREVTRNADVLYQQSQGEMSQLGQFYHQH